MTAKQQTKFLKRRYREITKDLDDWKGSFRNQMRIAAEVNTKVGKMAQGWLTRKGLQWES